jgi:hypothetical protein
MGQLKSRCSISSARVHALCQLHSRQCSPCPSNPPPPPHTHTLQADQLESRCNTLKFEMQKLIDDDDTCALMQLTELSQRGTIGAADLASVDTSEAELLLEE